MAISLYDVTLRDGSHAIKHQLNEEQIKQYCIKADNAGCDYIEVGHGIGLGASSLLIGESLLTDSQMLKIARANIKKSKLAVHVVPGYATVKRDISNALDLGVDVFRIATQCTEADTSKQHITFLRRNGVRVYSGLMMSHMLSPRRLVEEAKKMESFGSECITILDSAGKYLPDDVKERIALLRNNLSIPIGFHAHNNLGLAVANSLAAIEEGAKVVDASIIGFGAGAGNAPIELIAAACEAKNIDTNVNLYELLDLADEAEELFKYRPIIQSNSVISGLTGVVSVFSKPVKAASEKYNVDSRDIYVELGKRGAIAGQEDLIFEVAEYLSEKK